MRALTVFFYWALAPLSIVIGVVMIFRGFSALTEPNLSSDIAGYWLLRVVLGFCLVALGYWFVKRARMKNPASGPSDYVEAGVTTDVGATSTGRAARVAGSIAVVLAILVAVGAAFGGTLSASDAGKLLGGLALVFLLVVGVPRLLFRKRSEVTKARVTLVTGVIVLAWSVLSTLGHVSNSEREEVKRAAAGFQQTLRDAQIAGESKVNAGSNTTPQPALGVSAATRSDSGAASAPRSALARLLNQVTELRKEHTKRETSLKQRFDAIDLSKALAPASLVSPQMLKQSRAALAEYAKLIVERKVLYEEWISQLRATISSSDLSPSEKGKLLDKFYSEGNRHSVALSALDTAERNVVDAMTKILDLAGAQGQLALKDGQLLFKTQQQLDTYRAQVARVRQNEQDAAKAFEDIKRITEENQASAQRALSSLK